MAGIVRVSLVVAALLGALAVGVAVLVWIA